MLARHYCMAKHIQYTLKYSLPSWQIRERLLFWLVCFGLERKDLALAESVPLRLGPRKSYGDDFITTFISRCKQSHSPVLSVFWEIPVACVS